MNLITYTAPDGFKIIFEPTDEMPIAFYRTKKYCNTFFLMKGNFEDGTFDIELCKPSTQEDIDFYNFLRKVSGHLYDVQ